MNWPLAFRAYRFLGPIEVAAAMAAFFFVLHRAGWNYGDTMAAQDPAYLQATTACLSTIIVMQIVNVFLCRSSARSIFATGLLGNRLIMLGVVLEIAVLLLGILVVEEARKRLARARLLDRSARSTDTA